MKTKSETMTLKTSVAEAGSERALVHVFNVGHGDCTLIEFERDGMVEFRLLCDGGTNLPVALLEHLDAATKTPGTPTIDVLVLSHVDKDHQGGLPELVESKVTVGEYWGPCLPAFNRLKGLFPTRVQAAVSRAQQFQNALPQATLVRYPLEGYAANFANRRVTVTLLSPAPRLIRTLMTASGVQLENLVGNSPLPLEWLQTTEEFDEESQGVGPLIDVFQVGSSIAPSDLAGINPHPTGTTSEKVAELLKEKLGVEFEPEFFGNSVLNDTSLVLAIDFHLIGKVRKRVLLSGDQENWNYITSKHPAGLGIDVLKAPHHGGRVFIDDHTEAIDQLYLWLRPTTVVVSAKGLHNLPRVDFRNALRKVGAALMCPNARPFEPLSAGATANAGELSCFKSYDCKPRNKGKFTVELSTTSHSANEAACVQGLGDRGVAPIVVLQQRVIEPDESFIRWTHGEVEKYASWVASRLAERHKEFSAAVDSSTTPISDSLLASAIGWEDLEHEARVKGHVHLVADPIPVFRYGENHRILTVVAKGRSPNDFKMYRVPSKGEITDVVSWVKSMPHIMLEAVFQPSTARSGNRVTILKLGDWKPFTKLMAGKLRMPEQVTEIEVLPHVLEVISRVFGARVCNFDRPFDVFNPSVSGKVWMHLVNVNLSTPFPALWDEPWKSFFAPYSKIDESKFQDLVDHATKDLFVPSAVASNRGEIACELHNTFMRGPDRYGSRQIALGDTFLAAFQDAQWKPLW